MGAQRMRTLAFVAGGLRDNVASEIMLELGKK